jgi:hypothetical protein
MCQPHKGAKNKGRSKMRDIRLKKLLLGTLFGALLMVGSAFTASAQNVSKEYRDWQQAQARAQREYHQYLRTGRASDYRDWQKAQQRAQRQYMQYQRALNRANLRVNRGYYNNGYYNAGYGVPGRMYRINRGGLYYTVDARGVELLRAAVQNGYNQGYRQGQIDRQYRRGYNFGIHSTYRTGTYGWQSHVARDQYQYYFQEGFLRGYEDGYNSTFRYGVRSNTGLNILSGVLNTILRIVD